ncbi:MAG TPA: 5-formyltetrahydrofolate cyclo-ligase [Woeseiaceae bacterium]|nr:5-formyltetrahydrofolate cyclo-ligase [Woeseiaceae bacterium]
MTIYSSDNPSGTSEPQSEPHEYASPPCYLHEIDPDYGGDRLTDAHAPRPSGTEDIRHWRDEQRRRLRARRERLSTDARADAAARIIRELQVSRLAEGHECIGLYWPRPGEIDLRALAHRWVGQEIEVALPVIEASGEPLAFWAWRPDMRMAEDGPWSIPRPCSRHLVEPTLLLVPMLGFDRDLHRLGNGGGYYDRTLAAMQPPPVAVGICHEFGHMPTIYPQAHDVPMDAVVTEGDDRTAYHESGAPP